MNGQALTIALAAVGTRGDVQPIIALAHALRAAGHQVRVAAPPDFADWIRREGFTYNPVGVNVHDYLRDNPGLFTGNPRQSLQAATRYFAQEAPVHAQDLLAHCEGADVVAWGGLAFVAMSVAQRLRIPSLCVFYTTCMLPSGQHPPPNIPWHGLPRWINHCFWAINHLLSSRVAGNANNAARARLGLEPVNFKRYMLDAGHYIIAADPELLPHDPAWGDKVRPANYIYYDDTQPLDASLQAWLDDGEPPVFVGFGSMSGSNTHRMEQLLREAMPQVGRRCLIGSGWAGLGAGALPADWRVVREAPHAKLFPRVAAIVHHGGSGTTANALRSGTPQLILPLILDQYHHAYRLHVAGLMVRPVSMEKITAAQLAHGILSAIRQPPGPRLAIAQRLQASDGTGDVVREIERLARQPRQSAPPPDGNHHA